MFYFFLYSFLLPWFLISKSDRSIIFKWRHKYAPYKYKFNCPILCSNLFYKPKAKKWKLAIRNKLFFFILNPFYTFTYCISKINLSPSSISLMIVLAICSFFIKGITVSCCELNQAIGANILS